MRILVSRPRFEIGYRQLGGFGVGPLLLILVGIVGFVLWIVCMINTAQGARFIVPIAGEIAQNLAEGREPGNRCSSGSQGLMAKRIKNCREDV
jgi:hypothetical protein